MGVIKDEETSNRLADAFQNTRMPESGGITTLQPSSTGTGGSYVTSTTAIISTSATTHTKGYLSAVVVEGGE